MVRATVRELRYAFRKVEEKLHAGEAIEIVKRNKVIGTLVPTQPPSKPKKPDFRARMKSIWGNKTFEDSTASLLATERDRF
jgi:antitoxin (DNA-binding transcriptional repressor) of toxin-antitoxin stability system